MGLNGRLTHVVAACWSWTTTNATGRSIASTAASSRGLPHPLICRPATNARRSSSPSGARSDASASRKGKTRHQHSQAAILGVSRLDAGLATRRA